MKIIILLGSMPTQRPAPVYQAPLPRRVVLPEPEVVEARPVNATFYVASPGQVKGSSNWLDRWFLSGIYLLPFIVIAVLIPNRMPEADRPKPPKLYPHVAMTENNPDPKTYGVVTRRMLGLPAEPPPSIALCLYKGLTPGNSYAINIMTLRLAFQSTVMPTWTVLIPDFAAPIPSIE